MFGFYSETLGFVWETPTAPDASITASYPADTVTHGQRPPGEHVLTPAGWVDVGASTLDDLKDVKLDALALKRWQVQNGGVEVAGTPIPTDAETRATLTAARVLINEDPLYSIPKWKVSKGVYISLTSVQIIGISDAVAQHIQACFDHEGTLSDQVMAAIDETALDAIDIEDGWP
ncbi:DUF4376 domain-containing protein [Roseobacter sp.]|uniref:DUF4376 domain-containing protein n=1 Tax=Roseobacter sp. TaxID=1907202 RepID=UPI0029671787|nr:DUF4376 domain-containing protein [Roseobacter sp.]MDW3181781.1 DUF4376 domain-containing protein [Roseobacter sp.]